MHIIVFIVFLLISAFFHPITVAIRLTAGSRAKSTA